jgi:hypothetical protein
MAQSAESNRYLRFALLSTSCATVFVGTSVGPLDAIVGAVVELFAVPTLAFRGISKSSDEEVREQALLEARESQFLSATCFI